MDSKVGTMFKELINDPDPIVRTLFWIMMVCGVGSIICHFIAMIMVFAG
ncbi:hypothetical protein PMW_65 [Pseudomonas phage phiPMW]|uniref:Uncharacterized protein n=1 Tax=Pseudomonas phage phiPMW TaxID=1815582 RepID=A0A1S5R1A5_9CAUD|nr:hypothetical protein FDG97_gp065 [Pseudomonas phage phiPMW]ANA49190.1 hypothetical protein PMW_65 [Pseudomonas phage phiPMW]